MNLTINDIREIKTFLEENLSQPIEENLIFSMNLNKSLSKFFYHNLIPYISSDTSEPVRRWIFSLIL